MFARILLPLDGSARSEEVIVQGAQLLRDAEDVILLHAAGYPVGKRSDPAILQKADEYVRAIERRLSAEGIKARGLLAVGSPADAILETAERERVSLVAMTTYGRTGLARWTLGSVAEKVLRASPVPLLLVRPLEPRWERAKSWPRILVPLDGSDLSLSVASHVVQLARSLNAQVVLLHVFARTRSTHGPKAPQLPLATAKATFNRAGMAVDQDFRMGDPATEIVRACEDLSTDVIAMTTHGRSGISRWMMGSVAEKVLHAVRIPMLVVCCAANPTGAALVKAQEASGRPG